jgi:TctA family transporter
MVGGLDSRDHLRLCHWCLCGQQQYHGYLVNTDFGVVGSFCKKLDYPIAPMVLALVLGDMAESKLRQSLIMSQESPLILVTRPRSPVLVVLALGLFASPVIPALLHRWHQGLSGNWRLTRG